MTTSSEWNASAYHRVSEPQFRWGLARLSGLTLEGSETVVDAGCGSGRLTAELLERLPRGHVWAVDASEAMLAQAKRTLLPRFEGRVSLLRADLATLELPAPVDVLFSTATFHWVLDHDALFASLFRALKPSGRLHAQCGGGRNLEQLYGRVRRLLSQPNFVPFRAGEDHPTYFAGAEETRARLTRAGFLDVHTALEQAPTLMPDAEAYRAFLETVILRVPLSKLPTAELRSSLLDQMVALGAEDDVPWSLDYVRLNLTATRP